MGGKSEECDPLQDEKVEWRLLGDHAERPKRLTFRAPDNEKDWRFAFQVLKLQEPRRFLCAWHCSHVKIASLLLRLHQVLVQKHQVSKEAFAQSMAESFRGHARDRAAKETTKAEIGHTASKKPSSRDATKRLSGGAIETYKSAVRYLEEVICKPDPRCISRVCVPETVQALALAIFGFMEGKPEDSVLHPKFDSQRVGRRGRPSGSRPFQLLSTASMPLLQWAYKILANERDTEEEESKRRFPLQHVLAALWPHVEAMEEDLRALCHVQIKDDAESPCDAFVPMAEG